MELSDAMEHTKVRNVIPLDELASRLSAEHAGNTQRHANAMRGHAMITEGLSVLAALGHQFDIVPKSPTASLVFPKMLYRASGASVEEKLVENQEELDGAVKAEWTEEPSGIRHQSRVPEPKVEAEEPKPMHHGVKHTSAHRGR